MRPAAARRKRSLLSRLRPYWIVCSIVIALACWAAVVVASRPVFHLKSLTIRGLGRVARTDVVARAAIDPATNIWFLNKRAIEARVETLPYVAAAVVHRRPPADVTIDVSERVPAGCARDDGGRTVTIDRDDRIVQNGCAARTLPQFVVRDPLTVRVGSDLRTNEFTRLRSDARTLGADPGYRSFAHDRFGQLVVVRSDGIHVEFGDESDLARKQRLVAPILAAVGSRMREIEAVDLRAPTTPIVAFRAPPVHRSPQPIHTP